MVIQSDGDGYALSSGRVFRANLGIIGIGPDNDPAGGLDDRLCDDVNMDRPEEWTQAERTELADFMITRWEAFKVTTYVL